MALSGSFKTTDYNGRYLLFTWVATQSIESNTSTITWTLRGAGQASHTYYTSDNFKLVIDGETVYSSAGRINLAQNTVVANGTKKLYHTAGGTRSFSASAEAGIYTVAVNCRGSGSFTLDKIPQPAYLISVPAFNDEENPTITYTNPSGTIATKVVAQIVDGSRVLVSREISRTGTSYTFNLTEAERNILRAEVSHGYSAVQTFVLLTTIDGKVYEGSARNATYTIINGAPTITPFIQDIGMISTQLTGNPNILISGYNVANYAINATANKGATIKEISVRNGGTMLNTATGSFSYTEDPTFIFSATDSRYNTVEQTITMPMIAYTRITCEVNGSIELETEDNTKAKIIFDVRGNYYNGGFGAQENELTLTYEVVNSSNTTIASQTMIIPNSQLPEEDIPYSISYVIENLDYQDSYTVKVKVVDKTTFEATATTKALKAVPVFDWSETDFNFNVPVKFRGTEMDDFIIDQGIMNSWGYRKWNSGVLECWRRVQITTSVSSPWGGLYTSGSLSTMNLSYPFTFKETPTLITTLMPFGSGGILMATGNGYGSERQTGPIEIARGTSLSSGQFLVSYYATGRWK